MKKLRISVENRIYDVTVEVLEDDDHRAAPGGGERPGLPTPAVSAPPSLPPTAPAPSLPRGSATPGDVDTLYAPLAGTVLKVFVQAGAVLEEKAPVCLMEAMKMETWIYAPRTGEVAEVHIKPETTVQAGDPLIRYQS